MKYNFDNIIDRSKTDSIKWRLYDPDVIPLWVADMDFVSPEPVINALYQRVDHRIFGYPEYSKELVHTIVERMRDCYNWQIQPEDVLLLPGVVVAFNLACHTFAEINKGILIQTPVYPPFLTAAEHAGMKRQEMELSYGPDSRYLIDFNCFAESITPETSLFLLCNPHNPVGRVFRRDELERMAEICLRRGVPICSDEIHCDLVFSGERHLPIAALDPDIAQHTITLIAPSKTYNIAGLECSAAIIQNPELRKKYLRAKKGLVSSINILGMTAALAAYREGQEWLEQVLAYMESNRDFLFDFINQQLPDIKMWKPEGTYLAWLDCRSAGIEGNPHKFFLEKARVAMNDGCAFGRGGEGFVRLNFGCPRATLEEALYRMKNALVNER